MVTAKWIASLSDGTTAVEGEGLFTRGGAPMWERLLAHVKENGLSITGLRIQVEKDGEAVRTYNAPSCNSDRRTGTHEKWNYIRPVAPNSYTCRRVSEWVMGGPSGTTHIEILTEFDDYNVSLFIDVQEGTESWVVVHSTQK